MVRLLVFVVCGAVVLLGPVWREISEHITLGDLLEAVDGGREYLGRASDVVTAADERSPQHSTCLQQPISSFYSYGDRFCQIQSHCT